MKNNRIERLFFGIGTGLILVFAFRIRWPLITRTLWLDEVTHNLSNLVANSFRDVVHNAAAVGQPPFDYLARFYFWYPLVGHQELALRIPSLTYSLVAIALITVLTAKILSLSNRWAGWALTGGLLLGFYLARKEVEVWYAIEARHYSFLPLISLLWTLHFVFGQPTKKIWPFMVLSFVFMTTQLFAFPLATGAFVFEMFFLIRNRQFQTAKIFAGAFLFVFAGAFALDYPAYWSMTHPETCGGLAADPNIPFMTHVKAGFALWPEFLNYIQLPFFHGLIWIAIALGGSIILRQKKMAASKTAFLLFVVLPALFIKVRLSSDYSFAIRYFTPFFGIGAAIMVLAFASIGSLLERLKFTLAKTKATVVTSRLTPLVPLVLSIFLLIEINNRLESDLQYPPSNFSPTFHFFESLKRLHRPVLFVGNPCAEADTISSLYWNYLGEPAGGPTDPYESYINRATYAPILDQNDRTECNRTRLGPGTQAGAKIEDFLARSPAGLVVLFQVHSTCPKTPSPVSNYSPASVIRANLDVTCAWVVSGAKNREQVELIAKSEGYPIPMYFNQ